jgi:hypothetical protein
MRNALVIAATVSMISGATLLPPRAQAAPVGVQSGLRSAIAAVDTSERVCYYGCRWDNCRCGRPHYSYYRHYYPPRYYYSDYYYERPRHYHYDPGPYHDPLDLNWGYRTRWADDLSQY